MLLSLFSLVVFVYVLLLRWPFFFPGLLVLLCVVVIACVCMCLRVFELLLCVIVAYVWCLSCCCFLGCLDFWWVLVCCRVCRFA